MSSGYFYPYHGVCFRIEINGIIITVCTRCGQVWYTVSPESHTVDALFRPLQDPIHHALHRDVESINISELDRNREPNSVLNSDASPFNPILEGYGKPQERNYSVDNPDDFNPKVEGARNVTQASPFNPILEGYGKPQERNYSVVERPDDFNPKREGARNVTQEPNTDSALLKSQQDSIHHAFPRDAEHPDNGNSPHKDANIDFPDSPDDFNPKREGARNVTQASPINPKVEGNGKQHPDNYSDDSPDDFHPKGEGASNVTQANPDPPPKGEGASNVTQANPDPPPKEEGASNVTQANPDPPPKEEGARNYTQENATQPGTTSQSTKGENNTSWITAINTSDATEIVVLASIISIFIVLGLVCGVVTIAFILCKWTFYRIWTAFPSHNRIHFMHMDILQDKSAEEGGIEENSEETLLKREQGQRNIDTEGNE